MGIRVGLHVNNVGALGRGKLRLNGNFACVAIRHYRQLLPQSGDTLLHVLQVEEMQLSHLVPELGILSDH
jgi:hypothetical protein